MSKDSPAAILYNESGVAVGVEDNALRVAQDPVKVAVHSDATVTASSSMVLTGYGQTELILFINIKDTPTGTTPTLQYTIQEVDPGDETTVIGNALVGTAFSDTGTEQLPFVTLNGGAVKVSWAIGGTDTPSFTGVYATVLAKSGGATKMLGIGRGASYPDPSGNYPEPADGDKETLGIDDYGNLMTRGPVLTDEDSYFDDFITPTPDPSWVFDVDGGSYVVVSSILVLSAGTLTDQHVWVFREGDYGPMTVTAIMRIDYRQNNQSTGFGFSNDYPPGAPAIKRALVKFDDTNPRLIHFTTYASATQIEETDVNIPDGGQSGEWHRYTIEVGSGYVALMIDGTLLATHKRHIPGPYDTMGYGVTVDNSGDTPLATTVYVDSISFRNHNAVEIAGHFTGDPIRVRLENHPSVGIRGQHADVVVEHEGIVARGGAVEGGRELLAVADPEMRSTLNKILEEFKKLNVVMSEMSGQRIASGDYEDE